MKKRNSLLALFLVVTMLVTLFSSALAVSAEGAGGVVEVKSTLDFASLAKDTNTATAVEAIKAAGAVDASGLMLEDCYSVMATPANGGEIAYYIQKLDAGEGRVFLSAPVVDLTFWCATGAGAILVEGSLDGETYYQFYYENQGFGEEWQTSARGTKRVALHGAEGQRYAYVKVSMLRNNGPTTSAVVKSVVSAQTVAADAATVKNTINFGSLTVTGDDVKGSDGAAVKAADAEAIKALGAVEVSNLWASRIYEVHADPGGYAGAGYYVQKLEAGEGKVFDGAPVFEMNYWLATNDPQGYIKVEGSLDGETYYPFLELKEGQGGAYATVTEGDAVVVLNGAEGASVVYVRVTMEHWAAPTGAAVSSSVINAAVKDAPTQEPENPENPENPNPDTPSAPITGDVSSTVDFTAQSSFAGVGFDEFADTAPSLAAMQALGLTVPEGSNPWQLQDCYHVFATPTNGHADAVYIQKMEAGEGMVMSEDVKLYMLYWLAAESDGLGSDYTPGKFIVEVSTDGQTWKTAYSDTTGRGKEWEADPCIENSITLPDTAGASTVYIKVTVERHGGQTSGGVSKTIMTGNVISAADYVPSTGDVVALVVALAALSATGAALITKKSR